MSLNLENDENELIKGSLEFYRGRQINLKLTTLNIKTPALVPCYPPAIAGPGGRLDVRRGAGGGECAWHLQTREGGNRILGQKEEGLYRGEFAGGGGDSDHINAQGDSEGGVAGGSKLDACIEGLV